ncbi:hypothetical protein CS542_02475 [Pedobacter sp. IW39]|nr:hypothetical protein CS542_02475 [Pedobacter sp. IW39]
MRRRALKNIRVKNLFTRKFRQGTSYYNSKQAIRILLPAGAYAESRLLSSSTTGKFAGIQK